MVCFNGTTKCVSTLMITTIFLLLRANLTKSFEINSLTVSSRHPPAFRITPKRKFSTFICASETNTQPQREGQGEDEESNKLYVGEDARKSIQSLGVNFGYLEANKKRTQEAKEKYLEEVRREEEEVEARRKEKEATNGDESLENYGPGDLNEFKGFVNDGYEDSVGNDSEGGWGDIKAAEAEEGEDSKLLLLDADDDETGKLIL